MITPSTVSTPAGRTTRVEYRALANFRYQMRLFQRASEDAARQSGLEPQQHQLLLALMGAPAGHAPTIAWLAERLQLQHHSTVGLIDRLVEKSMVRRERDPADHRRVLVSLTDAGEQILHDLSVFHQRELRTRAPEFISAIASIVRSASKK
jgi:DNA-binding MarR family transcriptional regulator